MPKTTDSDSHTIKKKKKKEEEEKKKKKKEEEEEKKKKKVSPIMTRAHMYVEQIKLKVDSHNPD